MLRIVTQFLAAEVRFGNIVHVKRKRRRRNNMKFSDAAGPLPSLFETADQVGRIPAVHTKLPRRQTDLPVLMRIQPGED